MPRLSSEVQRAIVRGLAMFRTPTEVQTEIRELYQVEVPLPQILYYDPESAGTDVAPVWRELFRETREKFIRATDDVAVAHRAYRIRELGDLYRRAKTRNPLAAAKLLEQAAREMGDAYTNVQVLKGDSAEAAARLLNMTPEEVRVEMARLEAERAGKAA